MISTLRKRHQTIVSNKKRRYSSRTRKRRTSKRGRCALIISVAAFFILLCCVIVSFIVRNNRDNTVQAQKILPKLSIQTKLIQKNKYSRPGIALKKVKGVVIHYTANPGTDAEDNRNYFNNLPKLNVGKQKATYASSHFVIGLEGQIVQCIPLNEIAYASNGRNYDTISIECCHPGKDGKFNNTTYQALIELVSYLCLKYDLTKEQVIRHYDVTGKLCPLYFVKHEDEWNQLKDKIEKNCQTISES